MLQTQTVQPELLELLKALMKSPELESFYLVGGTSLALQLGHRESIDIDLFGPDYLEAIEILDILNELGNVNPLKLSKPIKIYEVNGIKVDFVTYKYPWLEPPIIENDLRLASKKDIAAMKINAIVGRGSKKDFIDLYYLLKEFTFEEILSFYQKKFHDASIFLAMKSIHFFEDADIQEEPRLAENISWTQIKETIQKAAKAL